MNLNFHAGAKLVTSLVVLATFAFGAVHATAQTAASAFPTRPIKIIVPYPAGGGTDLVARVLAQELTNAWGQPVVVQNIAGAAGSVGTGAAARSPADGYTIVIVPNSHVISASLTPRPNYHAVNDFEPVSLITSYPYVLVVHPSVPVTSVAELLTLARAKPGEVMYASSGNGTAGHLGMELLLTSAATPMTHVPYTGSNPALLDIMAGRVPTMFDPLATTAPLIRAGKLRPLAVSTPKRSSTLPDVPTVAESSGVKDFDLSGWLGVLAPVGTPRPIVDKYNAELAKILKNPAIRQQLERNGQDPQTSTPEEFRSMMLSEIAKWAKVIQSAGLK